MLLTKKKDKLLIKDEKNMKKYYAILTFVSMSAIIYYKLYTKGVLL